MNYLEHETEVKYVDGLLAHSQEWQWLIEKIQERFEVKEVDSWEEYLNESIAMRKMFQYFVKVLEVCDGEWKYRKVIHAEMWEIAKFYIGKISLDACMQKVSYNVCKLFLLCVWMADSSLVAHVITEKFMKYVPLYRQEKLFSIN